MTYTPTETLYKARKVGEERMLQAPIGTQGYFRREIKVDEHDNLVSITYIKVA